jgi:aspartyl-tRNA(Asn)/glutamyl-tRNA(Gln) amidotransferase subunit C
MPKFDQHTIENLSQLARIELTSEEKIRLEKDLDKILNFFDSLKEIGTEGVRPTYHVASDLVNVFRPDDELDSEVAKEEILDRATFLNLAPEQVAGMVKVPSFLAGGKEE